MAELENVRTPGGDKIHIRVVGRFTAAVAMDLAAVMKNTCHACGDQGSRTS